MKSNFKPEPVVPEIPKIDWRNKYPKAEEIKSYRLENSADDSTLNRMVQLKVYNKTDIVQGEPGKLYYDKENKKVKIFISETDGWANLDYTIAGSPSNSPSVSPSA